MDGIPLLLLTCLILTERIVNAADCNTNFGDSPFQKKFDFSASSEAIDYTASDVFTFGWCAATNTGTPHIDVDFKIPYGISGITIQGPTGKGSQPYPTNVLVMYVPNGGDVNNFIHFPLQEGKLEIKLNQPGQAQSNFAQSIAVRKLRFIIQGFSGEACLKIDLTGCTINELCSGGCQQNGGLCVMKDTCQCPQGSLGDNCELKPCVPAVLGLADGRIGADQVTASSQDPVYNEAEIGNSDSKKGWCPALTDQSPWVQIKLDQPKAVSIFQFSWSQNGPNNILTEFELQYIAAVDSSRRFRTFATDIPAMNNTHIFKVSIEPAVVTDTIRIIPSKWDNRPCFKLEIQGCDPKALCSANWCLNGGSCIGQNICKCPSGFVGSRCEQATNEITATNMTFVKIENNIIVTTTATLQFHITGNVQLLVIENKPVVSISGTNSYITLNQTTGTSSCVTDINHCTNGFTFTIDVNFSQLLDNTYIVSSGGHLPNHSGITLFYANNQLNYIVSTTTQQWAVTVNYPPVLNQWQHFELTWNKHLGIEILVNGHTLGSNSQPSSRPVSSKTVNLCIGCSHSTTGNVNINMQVTAIHSWSLDRTELVNAGVKEPPATTSIPGSTQTSTRATTTAKLTSVVATTTKPVASCVPENLGLADGSIGANQITVSSQDNDYNKEEIGNVEDKKGWCPAVTDNSSWVQVKIDQPKAVSVFRFSWSRKGSHTILKEFELQYIPAIDSTRRFRSYAKDIPAMNNTHVLEVIITPAVVTDTILIIPSKWDNRPCFKLEIQGCDPKVLCSAGWCLNGGTCMGENICSCLSGFVGSRCEQTTSEITATNMTFVKIENNIIVTTTATLQFHVTGNVSFQVIENKPIVSISGTNSSITLNQTTGTSSCVTDINHCTNGFTFTIDVNFGQLLDNTYIVSSGGHLPGHSGITLFYANNQLHFIVSTTTQQWAVIVNYPPVLHQWQHFELTWNKHLGIEILVNGHTLGSNSQPSSRPVSSKTVNLCIGCSHSTTGNVNINMQVTAIHSWSLDRTELVNAGVKEPPATTTIPAPTPTSTVATTTLTVARCVPENLGLANGSIGADQISVSSQDTEYNKEEIGHVEDKKGWCPAVTDNSSWVQVKLDQPKAVSVFRFSWSGKGSNTILREFELKYIPAIDSTRRFRSYAKNIPAMNNTHIFMVSIEPAVVTDTIRIIPSKWDNRPCFKLEIQGCDPKVLCSAGWCMNGGTCMGENVCVCPNGFVGNRCEQKTSDITVTNMTFVKIENNIIVTTTTTLQFLITGNVQLQMIENKPVVSISGTNSYITLNQTTGTPSCVTDINHCTNGFTFTIDVNFGQLLDNTYIVSSGGHLLDHSGITLFYANNQLHYIVSTTTQIWTVVVNYPPVLHQWQHFELTWNKHLGIEILINGHSLGSNSQPSPRPTSSKIVNLCIACSHSTTGNVNIIMQITAVHSWSFDRTELVNAGVKEPPVTATTPKLSTVPVTSSTTLTSETVNIRTSPVYNSSSTEQGKPGTVTVTLTNGTSKTIEESSTMSTRTRSTATITSTTSGSESTPISTKRPVSETNFTQTTKSTSKRTTGTTPVSTITTTASVPPSLSRLTERPVTETNFTQTTNSTSRRTTGAKPLSTITTSASVPVSISRSTERPVTETDVTQPSKDTSTSTKGTTPTSTAISTLTEHNSTQKSTKQLENVTVDTQTSEQSSTKDIGTKPTSTIKSTVLVNKSYHSSTTDSENITMTTKTNIETKTPQTSPDSTDRSTTTLTTEAISKTVITQAVAQSTSLGQNVTKTSLVVSSGKSDATSSTMTDNPIITDNMSTTTVKTSTLTVNLTSSTRSLASESTTYRASSPTSRPSYQQFNLTFLSIVDNILITPAFNFTLHNKPELELENNSHTALVLDCLKDQYVELPDKGIPCLERLEDCNDGFTFQLEVLFTKLEPAKKMYILSSGGDVVGSSGMAIYIHSYQLIFGVKFGFQHWTDNYNMTGIIKENKWYKFEVSWNVTEGILVLIDGYEVINTKYWTPSPAFAKSNSVLIGKTEGANETACIKVRDLFTWTTHREVLVDQGIVQAPSTSTRTPAPTTTVKATIPTTTQIPVPTFSWNLTTVTDNIIIGNHYNLTVHGSPIVSNVGIQISSSTQYIEFGSHRENCLIQPETCSHGLTIRFTIMFKKYSENTYFFTSGGQLPDGVGLAIVYRFGKIHFILTTTNQSWFINCKKNEIPPNKYHTIMLSWQLATGLEVFVNNTLVEETKVPDPHQSVLLNATTVYFGKQPTASVKVDFILQTITIWYVHVDILVEQGKCEPPVRPTTTQSTRVTTVPTKPTATTNRVTFSSLMTTSGPQQCPAGCVSITTVQSSPTKPVTTAKPPVTATTRKSTTPAPTTKPKPSATTSSFVPTPDTATPPPPTTRKPVPDFNQLPTIHVTVEKDNNAYIACAFKPTTAKDVQIEASLHVEGKIRLVITVSGNTGLAMFALSKVNMYLYSKEIKCSVKAHYIGSSLTTQSFFSNVFRPLITVTPGRVIVIEGHSKEFVTVTSTAPPQFYCCDGCKGQCQVHIVGTFHYERYFQKCNRDYISQAVIESIKPPNFNEHICGYALTVQNWNQKNKIEIKATIDGRRDGDHTIKLDIIGNVYNQPPTAQITVKPYSFTVTAVQVTVKDNDHGLSQCKSVNDPHLRTFDGQNYDNMMAGEFILFRHTTLPFEVRAVYYKCSKRSHATCNCAVAVKSGDDVIAVTGCQGYEGGHPGQGHGIGLLLQQMFGSHGHAHGHNKDELAKTPMTIQIYKNGELTPGTYIRRIGCGQKYEIELPTGMVVTVQQSWKPFINIWIQGSSSDRNQAEGLCGNFDGSRTNDLKPSVSSFINRWKVNNGVFFNGVGVSSHSVTSTYCSCVHGKNKVCLAGVGAFRCASSRYDITTTLVQHAKRPVLSRRKRQADTDPVPPSTEIPPDENDFTYEEAEKKCYDTIMSSKVTTSCKPILTSNLTQQIDNCAHDYNATGNFEWSADALRDIIVDCVEAANTLRVANETGNTNVTDEFPDIDNIDEILGKLEVCLEDCGEHGNCTDGVCVCEDGYSGINCNISKQTKPTVLSAPYLCDVMDTSDCMAAPIFGDNFVDSDTLSCHYEFLKISGEVADTGDKGKVRAVYISINQVTCPLPRLQSARLSVSNDGQAQSDNMTIHVVYSSVCFECTVTPTCTRKDNNCLIDGVCYEDSATRPGDNCQICRPVANSSEWSRNNIDECLSEPVAIVQDNDKEKTQILALAIVCGVLAAIILIGLIYCIKSRMGKKSSKGEYGEYDFTGSQNLHRDPFTSVNNLVYDEKM